MSGERVDLDDLLVKATAALGAKYVVGHPHRDGLFDVLAGDDGAEVYERCMLVDAELAVAAQPAVVMALVERIRALESAAREIADAPHRRAQAGRIGIMRSIIDKGVVLP